MPDTESIESWIGRERIERDELAIAPGRGLAALLNRPVDSLDRGVPLPPGWHWLYFWPITPQSELAADGHARRGGFLPKVSLPRRMWVGGRIVFRSQLLLGDLVERRSTIIGAQEKEGKSGRLILVTVRHEISRGGEPAIEEEQDLAYREPARPDERRAGGDPPPADCQWEEVFPTDPVVLFRFSALTFNGHRIHYDHPYATGVEGYPGLVVHGPLTALLLLDAGIRHGPGSWPSRYSYRALGPVFGGEPLRLTGRLPNDDTVEVWAAAPDGRAAMSGTLGWRVER